MVRTGITIIPTIMRIIMVMPMDGTMPRSWP